jgi:uncharacterized protein (TIGR03067 family)
MKTRLLLLVVGLCVVANSTKSDEGNGEKKVEGTWKGVSFKHVSPKNPQSAPPGFGKNRDEIAKATWVIGEDKIKITFNWVLTADDKVAKVTKRTSEMTYKIDWTKQPATIDLKPCAFPYSEIIKGISKGIIEVDGDSLKICYGEPRDERPASFNADVKTFYLVFELKRDTDPKDKIKKD